MKPTMTLAALGTAALLMTTSAASAQPVPFSAIDSNGDGLLSYQELVDRFGTAGANSVWARGDGQPLSRSDIARPSWNDDDDDRGFGGRDDDDDGRGFGGRDDDDDDGGFGGPDDDDDDGGFGGRDDDDDDGGFSGRDDDDDDRGSGGRDDDDDDRDDDDD